MWSNRDCFTWFRFRLDNHSILFYVVFWQLLQCAFPRKAILIGVVRRKERRNAGKWCILCKCISFITFVYSHEWHRKTKEHLQWVLKNTKKRYGKTLSSLLHYICVLYFSLSPNPMLTLLYFCKQNLTQLFWQKHQNNPDTFVTFPSIHSFLYPLLYSFCIR